MKNFIWSSSDGKTLRQKIEKMPEGVFGANITGREKGMVNKMKQIGILYQYELKKILKKKLVWVTFFACMAIAVTAAVADLTGSYYVDGEIVDTHYHMFLVDSGYEKQMSGRKIGQEMLEEMEEGYGEIPAAADGRYTLTDEYHTYARPYCAIFNTVRRWTGMDADALMHWEADEEELYAMREALRKELCEQLFLTEQEKAFWEKKEAQVEKPLTWFYHEGYSALLRKLKLLSLLMLLLTAVCLSGIFPEEHVRRTDQLILCCSRGRKDVYMAKILAGVSISLAAVLSMAGVTAALLFGLYGTEGFGAAFGLYPTRNLYSYPLTMGEACLIAYGVLFVTAFLFGVSVMVLSELLHNGMATLAVSTGTVIAGLVCRIPEQYRILSQIWDWLPMSFSNIWNIFDTRLLILYGHGFVSWMAVPVLYLLGSGMLVAAGSRVYKRYQVSGR